jgi:cytidylate kinase
MNKILITLDGPSGVGKTTVGKKLANDLNLDFFSSGALYRALAKFNLSTKKIIFENFHIDSLSPFKCKIDEIVITENELYTNDLNEKSSEIAQLSEVRGVIQNILHSIYNETLKGLVVEGRDMGSVVFPNANLKIYLDASEEVRSLRRKVQSNNQETIDDIRTRDTRDKNRVNSPLVVPNGAFLIQTDNFTIDETIILIKEKLKLQ